MNIPTQIYIADTTELKNETIFMRLYDEVSDERRAKVDAMRFEKDKRLALGAGYLLKSVLAKYGISDQKIVYRKNKKPYVEGNDELFFNLSHSEHRVMCAVAGQEIGCDVEKITDIDMEIARRFFYFEEYEALEQCEDVMQQRELFFRYWTLKESFMKVTGLGFMLPLDEFCIHISDDRIRVAQKVDRRDYFFREFGFDDGYRYAVCMADRDFLPHVAPVVFSFSD